MKKYCISYCLFLLTLTLYGQGSNCASMEPICSGDGSLVFASATGTNVSNQDALDFACLFSQPNPSWFYIKTDQAGSINFDLKQVDNAGLPMDCDFICWGPFAGPAPICGASQLNSGKVVDCSYSDSATEQIYIPSTSVGQVYVLLITNFIGSPGQITLTQTNANQPNAGSTTCAILCPVTLGDDFVLCKDEIATLNAAFTPRGNFSPALTTIEWLHDGIILPDTTPSITISETGTYTVNIYNPACGPDMITDDIVVSAQGAFPTAVPGALTSLAPGGGYHVFDLTENTKVVLNDNDPALYAISYFETETGAEDGTAPIATATAYRGLDGQEIWVRVTNQLTGCYTLYYFTLNFIKYKTFITPNGDGYNEIWAINGLKGYKDARITIFDRYGRLIKELNPNSSSSKGSSWDGTFNGRMLPSDDYWFTVTYTNKQGRKIEHRSHFAMKR